MQMQLSNTGKTWSATYKLKMAYTNHKDKEIILWEAIKEWFGSSEFSSFYFDTESFIDKANFLEVL